MDCPACKTPGAYQGFSKVECQNPNCIYGPSIKEGLKVPCFLCGDLLDFDTSRPKQDGTVTTCGPSDYSKCIQRLISQKIGYEVEEYKE